MDGSGPYIWSGEHKSWVFDFVVASYMIENLVLHLPQSASKSIQVYQSDIL